MSRGILTPRQRRFVVHYVDNPNAGEAARAAGYSQKRPVTAGQRLLGNPMIASEIKLRQKERREILPIDAERVLDAIARIAFHSVEEAVQLRALDSLARHFGLYAARPFQPRPSPYNDAAYAKARAALQARMVRILKDERDKAPSYAEFDTGVPM